MKPATWDLQNKSNEDLLRIAERRLMRNFSKSNRVKGIKNRINIKLSKHQRGTLYADWYAAEAIRLFRERTIK